MNNAFEAFVLAFGNWSNTICRISDFLFGKPYFTGVGML